MPTAHRPGIQLVLASAVLYRTAGLFLRMADMDLWAMVGWRSIFAFLVLGGFLPARRKPTGGQGPASFGWPGLAACAVSVIASITCIAALRWTSVAHVVTVHATLPFVATGIAFVWLHDRVSPRLVLACALYGVPTTGLGHILSLIGSRLGGGGEAGLLSMLDVVLGPFWVRLVHDGRIALPVFLGGALVLASVAWYPGADRSQPVTA